MQSKKVEWLFRGNTILGLLLIFVKLYNIDKENVFTMFTSNTI